MNRTVRRPRAGSVPGLGLALLGLATAFLPAGAQQQQESREQLPVFSDVLDVRVVNVEVVVTDRSGERVTGLTTADFELLVDGRPVPIEYFTEVRGGLAVEGTLEAEPPAKGVPTLVRGEPVGTSYLVFIDDFFPRPPDRDRVLESLKQQVAQLGPRDRMAIVAFDGTGLKMLSTWSQSAEELERVLRQAQARSAYGLQREAERREEDLARVTARAGITTSDPRYELSLEERHYVDRLEGQVERVVAAASSTLRSFAAPPGRKVLLLLSGGWPNDPPEFVVNSLERLVMESDFKRGPELYAPLSDTANQLGYTVYAVDVPGLQWSGQPSAADAAPVFSPGESFVRESGIHQTLEFLARETGGQALLNSQRTDVLEAAVTDTRSYYWLGFTPDRKGDDQRHEVVVKVKRPELLVRNREGFLDFSRSREVTMAVESALYFGSPPSPEPLRVQLGRPEAAGRGKVRVPVSVAIPVDAITLLPQGDGFAVQLELRVAVLDERGDTSQVPVIPLAWVLPQKPEPGSYLPYTIELKMRRRNHDVVIALYDVPSGTILSTALEVAPQ